jgi:precorrin-2 dehydrogenase / sirohydrochlorin ferrochelatase
MMLNMTGKLAVVVGGGRIAYRKMLGLLEAGAQVTIISPVIHMNMEALLATHKIEWKNKMFEPQDIHDAFIVIAATNNQQVNEFIALSTGSHQLVNVVDCQELSDFYVPAKLERGDLTICVATGGASPTLAKVIRDELAVIYDDSYKDYLEFLAVSREKVKYSILDQRTKRCLLKDITDETYRKSKQKRQAFLEIINNICE